MASLRQEAPILELKSTSKSFGPTVALDDVSISFTVGEIHCLLGENGAGKSTVGKLIAGLYQPDVGTISVAGQAMVFTHPLEALAEGIALVYQELSLFPDLTVFENVCIGLENGLFRRPKKQAELARCEPILTELGLRPDLHTKLKDLPAAKQQLVEVAKALAKHPRIVVMDEPTSMLGHPERKALFAAIERLKLQDVTFILITHHLDEVIEFGDKVTVMKNGRVLTSLTLTPEVTAEDIAALLGAHDHDSDDKKSYVRSTVEKIRIAGLLDADGREKTISIAKGEVVGFYGVVGCGRERIMGALSGSKKAPDLAITLGERVYAPSTPHQASDCGVAFLATGRSANAIFASRSIEQNLTITQLSTFEKFGVIDSLAEAHAANEQLHIMGTRYGKSSDAIGSLSGGNQQKVLLARTLAHGKEVIVLEDPSAGIDIAAKHDIHNVIRAKADAGLTVLMFSSDLPETITHCDTVYTVFNGRIVNRYNTPSMRDEARIIADVLGSAKKPEPSPGIESI